MPHVNNNAEKQILDLVSQSQRKTRSREVKSPAQGHTPRRNRAFLSSPMLPPSPATARWRGTELVGEGHPHHSQAYLQHGAGLPLVAEAGKYSPAPRVSHSKVSDTSGFFLFLCFFFFVCFFTILFITISVLFSCKGIQQKLLKPSCPQNGAARFALPWCAPPPPQWGGEAGVLLTKESLQPWGPHWGHWRGMPVWEGY